MENFIVSARKYRPETFHTVIGQPAITTTLKNAIRTSQLAHAYLFCGPRGIGKTTCARIFARTINCFNITPATEACNECESCLSFNTSRSYNIHELDGASNNSVDDIRNLIEQVRIPPQIGKYSIYIIDEVHMLSANAFNAFLKTLEEPPPHAIFILATTEKHKIIPTILSRCQIFDFNRIQIEDIASHLEFIARAENIEAERGGLDIIAQKADGAMRDALSIFDQIVSFSGGKITYRNVIDNLNVLDYDYYFKLTDALVSGNIPSALMIFNEVLNKGFDSHNFINGLSRHFRDLLVCRDEITLQLLEVGAKIREQYRNQSKECTPDFILNALDITNQCDLSFRTSRNQRLHVELCLVRLCSLQAAEKKNSEPSGNSLKRAVETPKTPGSGKTTPGGSLIAPSENMPLKMNSHSLQGKDNAVSPDRKLPEEKENESNFRNAGVSEETEADKPGKPGQSAPENVKHESNLFAPQTKFLGSNKVSVIPADDGTGNTIKSGLPETEGNDTVNTGLRDTRNQALPEAEGKETVSPGLRETVNQALPEGEGSETVNQTLREGEGSETVSPEVLETVNQALPEAEGSETVNQALPEGVGSDNINSGSFGKSINNTISIKDVMNGTSVTPEVRTADDPIEADDQEDAFLTPEIGDDFTEKELEEYWKKFANQIRSKHPRLYNTLLANKPSITSQTRIEFELSNPLQQEALDKIKPELLSHLRRELNRNIELLFSINETTKESRLYLPEDKYEYMLKKNPNLAAFKQKFNLDFD
jgi:DNA polymerase III subunit gamma/tau